MVKNRDESIQAIFHEFLAIITKKHCSHEFWHTIIFNPGLVREDNPLQVICSLPEDGATEINENQLWTLFKMCRGKGTLKQSTMISFCTLWVMCTFHWYAALWIHLEKGGGGNKNNPSTKFIQAPLPPRRCGGGGTQTLYFMDKITKMAFYEWLHK